METMPTIEKLPEGFCHLPETFSRDAVIQYLTDKRDRYRQWRDQAVARKDWAVATRFRQGFMVVDTILTDISDMR